MKTTKKPSKSSNMFRLAKGRFKAAFSLVELLVVIAVIGLIAAIAIPNIANLTGAASTGAAKRNAQNIVSTYSAAVAAGHSALGSEELCVNEITSATPVSAGGGSFNVPGMAGPDITAARAHISYANGMLTYTPDAGTD